MLTIRYSPLKHPEYIVLAKLLAPSVCAVEELHYDPVVYKSFGIELVDASAVVVSKDPVSIFARLLSLHGTAAMTPSVLQWLEWSYGPLQAELQSETSRVSLNGGFLAFLQERLAERQFLDPQRTTASSLSVDALVAVLVQGRMRCLGSTLASAYYRVVRWWNGVNAACRLGFTPVTTSAVDACASQLASTSLSSDAAKDIKIAKSNKDTAAKKTAAVKEDRSNIPPFYRVDIRVGRIVEVEKHPQADRLFVEKVDIGTGEPIQVVSGLVGMVPREELVGRLCLFVVNLKPAMLCKTLSQGMILVSKRVDGEGDAAKEVLQPLVVPPTAQPGMRLLLQGDQCESIPAGDAQLSSKENVWAGMVQPRLRCQNGQLVLLPERDGERVTPCLIAGKLAVTSDRVPDGIIS